MTTGGCVWGVTSQKLLDNFMLSDISGAKRAKLICDISEVIKCELDILTVVSLEVVEEVAKNINP